MERVIQIMKRKWKPFLFLFSSCCLLSLSGCSSIPIEYMKFDENKIREISYDPDRIGVNSFYRFMATDLTILDGKKISLLKNKPNFNAEAVFVSDETNHKVIHSENCFQKIYPASLTKLMTAYVTLKYEKNLSKEVVVTEEARKINESFAKMMGLMENDHITIETLLNAVLVHSSNDAAKVLSFAVGGSEEEFVKMMNQEAISLGAVDTNFTNPHGLHDDKHYTTLYDLYLIFHALMKDERFVKIIGQKEYVASYKNGLGGTIEKRLKSTNQYFLGGYPVPDGFMIYGGKTGTTDEAGYCMMIQASKSGVNYTMGIMKASDSINLYAGFSSIFENIP